MFDKLLRWIDGTKTWKWFASKVIANFTFRLWGHATFDMEDFFPIVDLIGEDSSRSIYAFACSDQMSLASKLIRWITKSGRYSHAGLILYDGDGYEYATALHMKGDGVHYDNLLNVLKEVDYFRVVRIRLTDAKMKIALQRIKDIIANQENIEYDFEQDLTNKGKIYCSELVYKVLEDLIPLETRKIAGRQVFDPDAVAQLGRVIYTNHPEDK